VECGGKRSATPLAARTQGAVAADALPAHSQFGLARYPRLVPEDAECAALLKKRTLTNLYDERPAWLALAHEKLDAAVAAAYGWPADLTDAQIVERLLAGSGTVGDVAGVWLAALTVCVLQSRLAAAREPAQQGAVLQEMLPEFSRLRRDEQEAGPGIMTDAVPGPPNGPLPPEVPARAVGNHGYGRRV
jgi:hypothetical protein